MARKVGRAKVARSIMRDATRPHRREAVRTTRTFSPGAENRHRRKREYRKVKIRLW